MKFSVPLDSGTFRSKIIMIQSMTIAFGEPAHVFDLNSTDKYLHSRIRPIGNVLPSVMSQILPVKAIQVSTAAHTDSFYMDWFSFIKPWDGVNWRIKVESDLRANI